MEETLTRQQAFMAIQIIDRMLATTIKKMAPEDQSAATKAVEASTCLARAMKELNDAPDL